MGAREGRAAVSPYTILAPTLSSVARPELLSEKQRHALTK
jgi:hypothetical protein